MKKTILILFTVATTLLCQAAFADNRHNRGYSKNYDYNYRGRDNYRGSRYNRRNNHYYSYNRSRNYRSGHFDGGSFIGGLVLGSILTYPRYSTSRRDNYYYRSAPIRRSPSVTVISRTPINTGTVAPGRRLLRDLEGRCYEILRDEDGNEIRTELEPAACNF